jgi:hypothetical protein
LTEGEIIAVVQPILDAAPAPLDYSIVCPLAIDGLLAAPTAPTASRVQVGVVPIPTTSLRICFAGCDVTVVKS